MELIYAVLVLASLHSLVVSDDQGDALIELRSSLNATPMQLPDWNPSMPNPCNWSNVNCDSDLSVVSVTLLSMGFSGSLSPKIGVLKTLTILILQGNDITGEIPKEIGNLSSLTRLDLESNSLTGEIPSSLGNLKRLQYLVLSRNNLSGSIPYSITNLLPKLINLQLASNDLSGQVPRHLFQVPIYNFTGNNLNCGINFQFLCSSASDNPDGSSKSKSSIILEIIGVLTGLLLCGGLLFLLWKGVHKNYIYEVFVDVSGEDDQRIALGQLKRFTWRELQLATDNFSEINVLGHGGFGKVYKGVLPDNTKIAVKRLTDCESPGGEAAFVREVELISVAIHRNILRLIGFCTIPSERILVYPLMQNSSVAYHLREVRASELLLDWSTRKKVALGTARGLEYLHEHCVPKIIHRDIKAANVLLDEDFEAVIGDFGLAKLVDVRKTNVTTKVRGTMGHIAPEYLSTGKSSERTDVFAYGIMLLELVTGLRVIDFSRLEDEDLLDHVKRLKPDKRMDAIVDHNLNKNYDSQELEMMIQIALLCTQASPENRPKMSEVVQMQEGKELGLAERWKELQQVEVTHKQEYEILQRFD